MKNLSVFNVLLAFAIVAAGVMLVRSGERTAAAAESAAESAKQAADAAKQLAGTMPVAAKQAHMPREAQQQRETPLPELAAAVAERSRLLAARSDYLAALQAHTRANYVVPAGVTETRCAVRIRQLPGGQIVELELLESCGTQAANEAVEQAIRASDPLPSPPRREVFTSKVEFDFHYP